MSRAVVFEVEVPNTLDRLRQPAAVDERLTALLARQDHDDGGLTSDERREAEGLPDLAELLSLLRLRAQRLGAEPAE